MMNSPSQSQRKIVFVTDVPCWRLQTGAQQRIMELARFLIQQGWNVKVVYLGSFAQELRSDFVKSHHKSLNFFSLIDDWRPKGFLESAIWKLKCILNAISRKFNEQNSGTQLKRLSSFVNPIFRQRFQNYLRDEKPEFVIVEYVTLSYLVPPRERRTGIQYWVDTHDLLSSRCLQFKESGCTHWVEITESEEAAALNEFDGIIAIESTEAESFRTLTHHQIPVVVAGHAVRPSVTAKIETNTGLSLGIIASDNQINRIEIQRFLTKVWPKVVQSSVNPSVRLVVAGSICNALDKFADLKGVERIGVVEKLEEFYDRIQIAINPIRFGTGLKIKSVEALSFGKPLIAARHSLVGLPIESNPLPFIAVDSDDEMVAAIKELSLDRAKLKAKSGSANDYANRFLRPEFVYRELAEQFRRSRE